MIKLFPSGLLLVILATGWDLSIRVGGRERRHSLTVPYCQKFLEKLTDEMKSSLRDIVQV